MSIIPRPAGPLVSIGMPVYNDERFIRQALKSILIGITGILS
jgi:hypothetical protein